MSPLDPVIVSRTPRPTLWFPAELTEIADIARRFHLAARYATARLVLTAALLLFVILLLAGFVLAKARRELTARIR